MEPESVVELAFELRGERRFMGLSLGRTHLVVPFRTVEAVRLSGSSPRWALAVGVVCVMAAAAVATTLVIWGISGRELSWILLGLLVLAAGVLLDGLAYLLVEIPLIQRFILFLGHPAYALTTVLFTLLLFSGWNCTPKKFPRARAAL